MSANLAGLSRFCLTWKMKLIFCVLTALGISRISLASASRCPGDWTEDPSTGSCYKILNEKMLWETARLKCASLNPNARLVEISSSQENQFVKGLFSQAPESNGFWMGANDIKTEDSWVWTDETPVNFTDWWYNEPNNYDGDEDCAMWRRWWTNGDFKWNDAPCNGRYGTFAAVCEIQGSPNNCKCGIASRRPTRIVGGVETEVNEYPWQVYLTTTTGQFFCGGSVIGDRWIITAAHCTDGRNAASFQVNLGDHDRSSSTETIMVSKRVKQVITHPNWSWDTLNYDFSLLELETSIDFSASLHIRPVCLPTGNADFGGFNAITTGWGRLYTGGPTSDKLMEVPLSVFTNEQCKEQYGAVLPLSITSQMICAADGGDKGSCHGDSGGPLVTSGSGNGVTPGQNYELIGVTSWGKGNQCGLVTVYARVTKVLSWIESTTKGSFNTCPRI